MTNIFSIDWYFISLLFFIGLYCLLISKNMIRQIIGLEIMSKACLLAVILSGAATNNINLAQAIAITMILIEVMVVAISLSIVFKFYKATGSIDLKKLS